MEVQEACPRLRRCIYSPLSRAVQLQAFHTFPLAPHKTNTPEVHLWHQSWGCFFFFILFFVCACELSYSESGEGLQLILEGQPAAWSPGCQMSTLDLLHQLCFLQDVWSNRLVPSWDLSELHWLNNDFHTKKNTPRCFCPVKIFFSLSPANWRHIVHKPPSRLSSCLPLPTRFTVPPLHKQSCGSFRSNFDAFKGTVSC